MQMSVCLQGVIHLTGLDWRREQPESPKGVPLPEVHRRVPLLVRVRRCLPGLSRLASVARRVRLPALCWRRVAGGRWSL